MTKQYRSETHPIHFTFDIDTQKKPVTVTLVGGSTQRSNISKPMPQTNKAQVIIVGWWQNTDSKPLNWRIYLVTIKPPSACSWSSKKQ